MNAKHAGDVVDTNSLYRVSVAQYHSMISAGSFDQDERVELIEGILWKRPTPRPPHVYCVQEVREQISRRLPSNWHYRQRMSVTLPDGEPEPDGSVVRGEIEDYGERHPHPSDVALVIEIADLSRELEQGVKYRSYARAGIPAYWLIDLTSCTCEVFTNPTGLIPEPHYATVNKFGESDSLRIEIDGNCIQFSLRSVLPATLSSVPKLQ